MSQHILIISQEFMATAKVQSLIPLLFLLVARHKDNPVLTRIKHTTVSAFGCILIAQVVACGDMFTPATRIDEPEETRVVKKNIAEIKEGLKWETIEEFSVNDSKQADLSNSTQITSKQSISITPGTIVIDPIVKTNNNPNSDPIHFLWTDLRIERVFPDISFDRTIDLTYPDDGTSRLFLALQPGRIMVFDKLRGLASVETYLDIRHQVNDRGNEEGLLGIAFDPKYSQTGYLYVHYSAEEPKRSVISRFKVDKENPNQANPDSEQIVLEIRQPFPNHNGGQIEFGPDGYLYIGLGDGGGANDPNNNGQNLTTLLGSILRIDVEQIDLHGTYGIPTDNPFTHMKTDIHPEIWAYGLRNPWRFSFDRDTGDLWAGDVGQNSFEEIDIIESGNNYGWNTTEGFHCFPEGNSCDQSSIVFPIIQYGRDDGCSVTGGYVYRGTKHLFMYGTYVYGDFCTGKIWGLHYDGQKVTAHRQIVDSRIRISSFAEDQTGEIYILSLSGEIYLLTTK